MVELSQVVMQAAMVGNSARAVALFIYMFNGLLTNMK